MSNLLLRTLTLKSSIGFGNFKDYKVLDMISIEKHMFLVQIYYNLSKIDFNEEVKKRIFITKEREIEKPGKSGVMFDKYKKDILLDILQANQRGSVEQRMGMGRKEYFHKKRKTKFNNVLKEHGQNSKAKNARRNNKNR